MTPSITIYTDLIPKGVAGKTIGFIILIKPICSGDAGLHAHEQVHVKQFWNTFGIMPLLYAVNKKYRLKYEVEAYREQLKFYKDDRTSLFADFISTRYKLDITKEDAIKLLKGI